MRPIQNNLANLQINQMAAEQAALQAAKNQQPARARAETAEEILKEQDKKNSSSQENLAASSTNPDGKKKSNSQNFKNILYSKDGIPQTNTDNQPDESIHIPPVTHIDFRV
jgi:hypothetical protein